MSSAASIHVGIGGWDFDPWRGTFYPDGLPKTKQLEYMASRLTATEINATYYKLQKPELFERWGKAVPDGFKFAIKASRFCTNRKALGEGGEAVQRFCAQGLTAHHRRSFTPRAFELELARSCQRSATGWTRPPGKVTHSRRPEDSAGRPPGRDLERAHPAASEAPTAD